MIYQSYIAPAGVLLRKTGSLVAFTCRVGPQKRKIASSQNLLITEQNPGAILLRIDPV